MEFEEQDAIKFIRTRLSDNANHEYDDDDILNVIDIIWDYYEDNGMLEIDCASDVEDCCMEDISKYVVRMLKKDKLSNIKEEDVATIVKGELDYEASIEGFD